MADANDSDIPSDQERFDSLRRLEQHVFPSRRDLLKAGAAVATAGAMGLGVGNASADASTSDADGDVGQPGNRVDGFFDGVEPRGVGDTDVYASGFGDNEAAIQSALTENGSNPSVVHIDVSATVSGPLSIPDNTVVFVEEDLTLEAGSTNNILENSNHDDTQGTTNTNIHVIGRGGTLDGNRSNVTYDGSGQTQNPVSLREVTDSSVQNAPVINSASHNILISGSTNVRVNGCLSKNSNQRGIMVSRTSNDIECQNVTVIDNTVITPSQDGSITSSGIAVQATADGEVIGNHVRSAPNIGISVGTEDMGIACSDISVAENNIHCDQEGILVRAVGGASVNNVNVSDNTIDTTGSADSNARGINLLANNNNIIDCVIDGNTIRAARAGIRTRGTSTSQVLDCVVSDNVISISENQSGMFLAEAEGCVVSGNVVHDSALAGIKIQNVDNTTQNNTIRDNICHTNGTSSPAAAANDAGITLANCDSSDVTDNKCFNQGNGVVTTSDADNNVIVHNDLRGNTTALNDNATTTTTSLSGNVT